MASDDGAQDPWGRPPEPPPPGKPPRASVPPGDRPRPGRLTPGQGFSNPFPGFDPTRHPLWQRLFGGGGPRRPASGNPLHPWFAGGRAILLMALVVVALWLASGFYRVEPDEAGVVQRFGRFVRLTPPGLNYHLPWPFETVQLPSVTRINRIEVGYRSPNADSDDDTDTQPGTNGVRQVPQESLMLTGDENIIDINFAVFWRISDAARYLFATRAPDDTIKEVSESVMREVIGRTPIQPALTDARARIEADVLARSQAILDRYGTGVELTQVQLQKVDPPAEVIDSFRDVQRANTEAERMVNESQSYANNIIPRARGEAAAVTNAGEGAKAAAIAQATGDARRFESVLAAYQASPDITLKRLYIETMQDVLTHAPSIVVDGGMKNLVPLLPLNTPRLPVEPAIPGAAP